MLTGRVLALDDPDRTTIPGAIGRVVSRLGEPVIAARCAAACACWRGSS